MDLDLQSISVIWNLFILVAATAMFVIFGIIIYRDRKKNPQIKDGYNNIKQRALKEKSQQKNK
ncbi:MAG: hypothetical protein L3V56_05845 [Candidatus Magnetoovum sp. WYHC-5]|nr:hypothetical protein [Candidatus Magnetoovum sp. WYHC-5]